VLYAGGGGGGGGNGWTPGAGGSGGGRVGGGYNNLGPLTGASVNTGSGGGGGGGTNGFSSTGGNGGSGIVILRWNTSQIRINIGVGLISTTSTVGSDTVVTITGGTGTVSWS
jgi:hypothetical protein